MRRRWRQTAGWFGRALAAPGLLVGLLVVGAAVPAEAGATATAPATTSSARAALDLDLYESRVLHLVNERRTAHHLAPVRRISSCVDRLSEGWAAHLADTGDLVHRDQHVILDRCHMWWAGETLARGTAMTPSGAVTAWMHSSEHRAVLLKPRANRGGLGVRLDTQGRIVLVLNFTDTRS